MKSWPVAFVLCSSLVVGACTASEANRAVPLVAHNAWARTADSGAMTAAYFTLVNAGAESDTLIGVTSSAAATVEMHISTQHGAMMHMSPITALPIPADDSVQFKPLGAHVMLTGLVRPLSEGDSVTLSLSFRSGRTLAVKAGVRRP